MKIRSLVGVSIVGVFMFAFAPPASADTTGATPATITITGGALAITVPDTAVSLGSIMNSVGGGTINGSLGEVQVTDARSAAAGFVAVRPAAAWRPQMGPNSGEITACAADRSCAPFCLLNSERWEGRNWAAAGAK